MTVEELEFQISQYVDGTLSTSERQIINDVLRVDSVARTILADYQKLNGHLAMLRTEPAVRWDRFAQHVSASIAEQVVPAVVGRIGFFSSRWRIAAGLLIAATAALIGKHAMRPHHMAQTVTAVGDVVVSGPQPEVAVGASVQEITVGPSPSFAVHNTDGRYGEAVVGRGPAKVTILGALNPSANHDSNRH